MIQYLVITGVILLLTASNGEGSKTQESSNSIEDEIGAMVSKMIAMSQELRMLKAREESKKMSANKSLSLLFMAKEVKIARTILELGKTLKEKLKTVLSEDQITELNFE